MNFLKRILSKIWEHIKPVPFMFGGYDHEQAEFEKTRHINDTEN